MSSGIGTVARRYAAALADVVENSGEAEVVKSEMAVWEQLLTGNAELYEALSNPAIAHSDKEKILESLIQRTKTGKTTANFLRVLLRNGRITELGEAGRRFAAELEHRQGLSSARITSARELSDAERTELTASLEKRTGRKVRPEFEVDEGIIGGIITRIGSTIYDGSVRSMLNNLREEMIES
jgi:F-type H+-transporting ATPase subunit delta